MDAPMLQIGVSNETVKSAREMIMSIIEANVGEQVKMAALETARGICNASHATVQNCNFTSASEDVVKAVREEISALLEKRYKK